MIDFNLVDGADIAHAGNSEHFGNFRSDLSSVAVGSLKSADYNVELAELANALRERVACGKNVRAAEFPVGDKSAPVRAHCEGFVEYACGLRRSHSQDAETSAVFFTEP